jgi:thioredoxin reductase (NADPH)
VPGVYAVGDVRADSLKRVASAVGEGSVVISYIHRYLADRKNEISTQPDSRLSALRSVNTVAGGSESMSADLGVAVNGLLIS